MFRKFFGVFAFLSLVNVLANAYITIDMEGEKFKQLGELLVESYIEQSLILSTSRLRGNCKKITQSIVQIGSIMFSLVGANLLTGVLQPSAIENTPIEENRSVSTRSIKFKPSEVCKGHFGCDQNICWKGCGNNTLSWCFTTRDSQKIQVCTADIECSPCWDCLGHCHTPKA